MELGPGMLVGGELEDVNPGMLWAWSIGELESWKAEGRRNGFGRELDSCLWNDWREGEHGSIEWLGMAWSVGNIWMDTWIDGKGVIEMEDKGTLGDVDSYRTWVLGCLLAGNWKA